MMDTNKNVTQSNEYFSPASLGKYDARKNYPTAESVRSNKLIMDLYFPKYITLKIYVSLYRGKV
jgi:hypothetical protein